MSPTHTGYRPHKCKLLLTHTHKDTLLHMIHSSFVNITYRLLLYFQPAVREASVLNSEKWCYELSMIFCSCLKCVHVIWTLQFYFVRLLHRNDRWMYLKIARNCEALNDEMTSMGRLTWDDVEAHFIVNDILQLHL